MNGTSAVRGAQIAWTDEGEGPDVLLVHAGVADRRMWDPLVAELGGAVRTLRPDLRGFGETTAPAGPSDNAEDLVALLDDRGMATAHVVGASYGGQVALELADAAPGRVASLLLLAPPLPDHGWSTELEAYGAAEEAAIDAGDLDAAVEANVRMWVDGPARAPEDVDPAIRALVGDMQRRAFELQLAAEPEPAELDPARLGSIDVPATVAVGDLDVPDFAAIAERVAAELPRAQLRRIAGAGHLLALERPAEVAALVREAL